MCFWKAEEVPTLMNLIKSFSVLKDFQIFLGVFLISAIFDHEIEIAKLKFFERKKGIIAVITYYIVWVS